MFLESHQQILYWVSPATKHHEAKILFLRSIETFKVLMEGLQFPSVPIWRHKIRH